MKGHEMVRYGVVLFLMMNISAIHAQSRDVCLTSGEKLSRIQFDTLEDDTLYLQHDGTTRAVPVSEIETIRERTIPAVITWPAGVFVGGYCGFVAGSNLGILLFHTYQTILSPAGLLAGMIAGPIILNRYFTTVYPISDLPPDKRIETLQTFINE